MSASEVTESMRRAAQLRAEADGSGRDPELPGLVRRVWEGVVDSVMLLTLMALALDAFLAYRAFR